MSESVRKIDTTMKRSVQKPSVLLMGQTPPPWHGQAVATQILFDHDWPDFEVHRLRMEFSDEMEMVGRFQVKKIGHLLGLIRQTRRILKQHSGCILFYPPASAKWVPFLRDVVFLTAVRHLAGSTVFIFHASGLPVFTSRRWLRRILAHWAYGDADVALEVAKEEPSPHEIFAARSWKWCPCAIEVPEMDRVAHEPDCPLEVLFVGSLQEGKGVLEILRTAELLKGQGREESFRFRIVGKWFSEEFEIEARQLHADLRLEKMVEFVGQLTGEAKWQAYADADLFFFPTHYASEATPIVLMEALGLGLPIVSTRWAGIPAMLEGCETSRLFPVRSPDDYAEAMIEFENARESLPEAAERSRGFYRKHFQPERFIDRVAAAFKVCRNVGVAMPDGLRLPVDELIGGQKPLSISVYLADQNPGYDRSFGISRMSQTVLEALQPAGGVAVKVITSDSSQQPNFPVSRHQRLPWKTRNKLVRLLTDHGHPLMEIGGGTKAEIYYYPKGYLPWLGRLCRPAVVTIHDTIIQHSADQYPEWRQGFEYSYWKKVLKHTIRTADRVLTVSESAKSQIEAFMERYRLPIKPITVTYEPCHYEKIPQPEAPLKENYVLHLASCEPHKRTSDLVRWWATAEGEGRKLPTLHLVGSLPSEVRPLLARAKMIVERPFLEEEALLTAYTRAQALILPSEIEGFGLPALEAYYLGTPVCFVEGTSVAEVVGVATGKGAFTLSEPRSLFRALDDVLAMNPSEVYECGLKLREEYAAKKVAARLFEVFREVAGGD